MVLDDLNIDTTYALSPQAKGKIERPYIRFNHAVSLGNTLFREYKIHKPDMSSKDIFCLRMGRILNGYRKISIDKKDLRIKGVPTYERVEIRIVPDVKKDVSELRVWYRNKLVDVHYMKGLDFLKFFRELIEFLGSIPISRRPTDSIYNYIYYIE